jgi:hypothetical protein
LAGNVVVCAWPNIESWWKLAKMAGLFIWLSRGSIFDCLRDH